MTLWKTPVGHDCRLHGHRFEERQEVGTPPPEVVEKIMAASIGEPAEIAAAIEAACPVFYIRDVCVRCGETVERADGSTTA